MQSAADRMALFVGAVRSLYVLVKATTAVPFDASDGDTAAACCLEQLDELWNAEGHLVLQERRGWMVVNGVKLRPGVEDFVAVESLVQLLQRWDASEVLIGCDATSDDLVALSEVLGFADAAVPGIGLPELLQSRGITSIRAETLDPSDAGLPIASEAEEVDVSSAILAMFVANRVIAAVPHGRAARSILVRQIVELVVGDELLLRVLSILEREPAMFARSIGVALHAADLCQRMRLPRGLSDEIVTAALSHRVGELVDPLRPHAVAGFQFLLEQSRSAPSVLRAALVVRQLGGPTNAVRGNLSLWLVRAALALERGELPHRVAVRGLRDGWPDELADVVMGLCPHRAVG